MDCSILCDQNAKLFIRSKMTMYFSCLHLPNSVKQCFNDLLIEITSTIHLGKSFELLKWLGFKTLNLLKRSWIELSVKRVADICYSGPHCSGPLLSYLLQWPSLLRMVTLLSITVALTGYSVIYYSGPHCSVAEGVWWSPQQCGLRESRCSCKAGCDWFVCPVEWGNGRPS